MLPARRTAFALATLLALPALAQPDAPARTRPPRQTPQVESGIQQAVDLSTAFKEVARSVSPAVVGVRSVRRPAETREQQPPRGAPESPFRGSPFEFFFGDDPFERFFQQPGPRGNTPGAAFGSGVSVGGGYILTNNHVVAGADEVEVSAPDGRTYTATLVGADEKTDLAVLRVEDTGLPAAALGDSDAMEAGDWVIAIGNPFNFNHTVTAGIVSATGRANVGIADYEDFIQTDAAINPGNSGGPLVNLRGEVVGINTAIVTRTGGAMGIGFAIPVNMARDIMESIIHDGRVERGWIGVTIQDLTRGLSESFGFEGTSGVLVADVVRGGPADRAGLRAGDIITAYAGRPTSTVAQLRNAVAATRPGGSADVAVFRGGRTHELTLTVGELDQQTAAGGRSPRRDGNGTVERLGVTVETLTPESAQRIGIPVGRGLVVTRVTPNSPAARAGITAGQVIIMIGDDRVDTPEEFEEALRGADLARGVRMTVETAQGPRFVFVQAR